jgi:hypothetical protein
VRCKANYNNKQWDQGAAVLYAENIPEDLNMVRHIVQEQREKLDIVNSPLALCMKTSLETSGSSPDSCFTNILLFSQNVKRERYFMYERLDELETQTALIAACEVFTGPAKKNVSDFRDCVDGAGNDDCFIQPYVWSGRSSNKVPVAVEHAYMATSVAERAVQAQRHHEEIKVKLEAAFVIIGYEDNRELANTDPSVSWTGDRIEAQLFTTEGDLIHQAFDCAILGPYGRVDMWPGSIEDSLPTISYYRDTDDGNTREFELPCTGEALKGDTASPYTCGSNARRSIIKSFLRDKTSISNPMKSGSEIKNLVVKAVKEHIIEAASFYLSTSHYGCVCPDNADENLKPNHVKCCVLRLNGFDPLSQSLRELPGDEQKEILHNFLSDSVRDFTMSSIGSSMNMEGLLGSIMNYTRNDIWHSTDAMLRYNADESEYAWDEEQRSIAANEGLYSSTAYVKEYSMNEVAQPMHTTHFQMCMGLISQVFFTMPVKVSQAYTETDGDMRDVPATLDTLNMFDPMMQSPDEHLSSVEHFVSRVVQGSLEENPLHWSHTLRHIPSHSLVCEDVELTQNTSDSPDDLVDFADEVYVEMAELTGNLQSAVVKHHVKSLTVDGIEMVIPKSDANSVLHSTASHAASIGAFAKLCFCGWKHTTMHFPVANDSVANSSVANSSAANATGDALGNNTSRPRDRRHCQIPETVCNHRNWGGVPGDTGTVVAIACTFRAGMYDHAEHDHNVGVLM